MDTVGTPAGSDPHEPQESDISSRAGLLPEEQALGSADPQAQAEEILRDSINRTDEPDDPDDLEHRGSDESV